MPRKKWLVPHQYGLPADYALLILRMVSGLMMMTHGWPKLSGFAEKAPDFYNFLGLGGPVSLGLTVFAEFLCAFLVAAGLLTRVALIPLIILTVVIVLVIHGADPLGDKETGLLYLMSFCAIFLTGPGRFALDHVLWTSRKSNS